jgi:hypothetical protein
MNRCSLPENKKADLHKRSAGAVIKVGLLFNESLGRAEILFAESSVSLFYMHSATRASQWDKSLVPNYSQIQIDDG